MKKLKFPLLQILLSVMLLQACEESVQPVPELRIISGKETSAGSRGGEYDIKYEILNRADGNSGEISVTSGDADWISGIDISVDGLVRFTVEPNESGSRRAVLKLEYRNSGQYCYAEHTVVQMDRPVLSFPEETFRVNSAAGNHFAEYSGEGLSSQGKVTAYSEAEWISGISVNSQDNTILFHVSGNDTGEERQAALVLEYTSPDSDPVSATLTVSQSAASEFTAELTVKKDSYVKFTVIPGNAGMDYLPFVLPKDEFDNYGDDESLTGGYLESLASDAVSEGVALEEYLSGKVRKGTAYLTFEGLSPQTDYVFCVFGLEVGQEPEVLTGVVSVPFTTQEAPEVVDCTFDLSVIHKGLNAELNVLPSDMNTDYLFDVVPEEELSAYGSDAESSLPLFISDLLAVYAMQGIPSDYITVTGEKSRKYFRLAPETAYYAYVVGVDKSLSQTTGVEYYRFETEPDRLSDVTITADCSRFFNGDEVAELYPEEYGSAAGNAIIDTGIETDGYGYFYCIFEGDITDETQYPADIVIDRLEYFGYDSPRMFSIPWDSEFTMLAVAYDENGFYGRIFRQKGILKKDEALPVSEFPVARTMSNCLPVKRM